MKKLIQERLNEFNQNMINDEPVTVTKGLLVNIIFKHMQCNSIFKNYVGKFLNVDTIKSDEHLIQLLNTLDNKRLEDLLLKI